MPANYYVEDLGEGPNLVVTDAWSDDIARALAAGGIEGLTLNYARGFKGGDLRFIDGLPLRRLNLLARTIDDLGVLYTLGGTLESLNLTAGSAARLDLSRFPHLVDLGTDLAHVFESIHSATSLRSLYLGGYAWADLQPLGGLIELESLQLKDRPAVESLDGLQNFPKLTSLQVAGASKLRDLTALRDQAPRLKSLDFRGSTKFSELDDMSSLANLELLDISQCGSIYSLRPLTSLARLAELFMSESTRIEDSDLSPLLALPKLRELSIQPRKSYQPSVFEIKTVIESRDHESPE